MELAPTLEKLKQLALTEPGDDFEDSLSALTTAVGECLQARRVSLMLLDSEGDKGQALKLVALHGELPQAAWDERPHAGQGIAARVWAEGKSLHVEDIASSRLEAAGRHPREIPSFIACPVPIAGRCAGVLNISNSATRMPFDSTQFALAEIAAAVVGRAVQLFRLQGMLDSSFAKMAMALDGVSDSRTFMRLSTHEPQKVAKILAKAFYREMHRCGFSANQILHAAGEMIAALSHNINRHKQRLQQRD